MALTLHGIAVSRGIAIGRAQLIDPVRLDVAHYLIEADQIETEVQRLDDAVASVVNELYSIESDLPADSPPEFAALIELHRLILQDPLLSEEPQELIRERHYNAEWALATQLQAAAAQFAEMEDEYIAARHADVEQVIDRVLKVLTGTVNRLPEPAAGHDTTLIVAHDIAPADMILFKKRLFGGFVTDLGSTTSHSAIVARSLDLPAVVGLGHASRLIHQDEWLIVDGDAGVLIVDPSPMMLEEYRLKQQDLEIAQAKLKRLRHRPARTLDDIEIDLLSNIELPSDCTFADDVGSMGIGLYRTEFLFMNRHGVLPEEEEQFEAYRYVVEAMAPRPVTIRSLDIGADKSFDTDTPVSAANPALGLRAIRYCLAEPQMFLAQLRAILRASAFGRTKLLLPMLCHIDEIEQAKLLIAHAKDQLRARGQTFDEHLAVGGMIEIPAAALSLPSFVKRLDFLSIGTNDLIQYTLAVDRGDNAVADLYDPIHPAVLFLIASTIAAGERAGVPVSICGEMAGETSLVRLLLGLGLRQFSMHPAQMLAVKQEILRSDVSRCRTIGKKIMAQSEPAKIRALIETL